MHIPEPRYKKTIERIHNHTFIEYSCILVYQWTQPGSPDLKVHLGTLLCVN